MNNDILNKIIGLVVAAIPLIVAIVTLHNNRSENVSDPIIDSPSLKILNIKRTPVKDVPTNSQKIKFVTFLILSFVIEFLYIWFILYFHYSDQIAFTIGLFFINLLFFATIIVNYIYFIYKYRNVTYKSYALYNDICIKIEAEHHYLFNKCHESLKGLKFKILEVDEQNGKLVAFYVTSLGFVKPITVTVLKKDNSETLHEINLKLEGGDFADYAARSRVINRFINRLISKPMNADHKTKD